MLEGFEALLGGVSGAGRNLAVSSPREHGPCLRDLPRPLSLGTGHWVGREAGFCSKAQGGWEGLAGPFLGGCVWRVLLRKAA